MKEIFQEIYEEIKLPTFKFCIKYGITGNQITVFNHFITLTIGVYFFSVGEHWGWLLGLGVMIINGFLDYLDGDIAKKTGKTGELGVWLDSGFDVIIQNAVMGAIAIGCYNMGIELVWIIIFFIANAANNFISFNYNERFGFDSYRGNELFRKYMDKKGAIFNPFVKNLIDPTGSHFALVVYTFRYFIAVGCLFNVMPMCFKIMTCIATFKWVVMYCLYAMYLTGSKNLHVLKALAILDDKRNEFYALRSSGQVRKNNS